MLNLFKTGKNKGKVKPHRKVRKSCEHCGQPHSKSEHLSHGKGAFKRIHSHKRRKRR